MPDEQGRRVFGLDFAPPGDPRDLERVRNGKGRWGAYRTNPCLRLYGEGPEGKRCGSCSHLRANVLANTYYKCDLREISGGPLTDHRVRWPACGRYEEAPPDAP